MPPGLPPNVRVHHHPALPSTSTEAMRLAFAGEPGPFWVVTDDQTAGRGRDGRGWQSIPGNLYASYLAHLRCPVRVAPQLSLVAGVAVIEAVGDAVAEAGAVAPGGLRLKWPNDVLVGDAKMGGVLVETAVGEQAGTLAAVIGVGLNLAGHPEGLGRAATHLAAHAPRVAPHAMLRALAWQIERWLGIWDGGAGLAAIRQAWLARGLPLGAAVTVNTGAGVVAGAFAGLAEDGALLLRHPDGAVARYAWGDVAMTPTAAGDAA